MTDSRDNKTKRGRIAYSTRAIFYENLRKGLRLRVEGKTKAAQIKFLMEKALLSRTHAQRMVEVVSGVQTSDEAQAPNIDTLAFIAEAFGLTASEFLAQGCKFATDRHAQSEQIAALGQEALQPSPDRGVTRRRRA